MSVAENMRGSALNLSLVVPAFNEAPRLTETAVRLADAVAGGMIDPSSTELIVVDDGSTDGTAWVAQRLLAPTFFRMQVLRLPQNSGKGAAVRAGAAAATAPIIAFTDTDMSVDPTQIPLLLAGVRGADVVIGSRSMSDSFVECDSVHRVVMGRAFNLLVTTLTDIGFRDTQCGFKAFRTPVARLLFHLMVVDRFAFDVEILYLAQQLGMQISEVPVQWRESENSKVRPLSDSVSMVLDVLRLRFRKSLPPIPALVVTPDSSKRGSRRPPALTRAFSAFRQTDPLLPLARGRALLLLPLCTPTEVDGTALRIGKSSSNVMVRKRLISGTELMDMMPLSWSTGVSGQTDDVRDVGSPFPERRGTNGITHRVGNILRVDQEPVCSLEI